MLVAHVQCGCAIHTPQETLRDDSILVDIDEDEEGDEIDALEVFGKIAMPQQAPNTPAAFSHFLTSLHKPEHIRHINDPEHPLTLEQLKVTQLELVSVNDAESTVDIRFTPTIPHCSMATLIGLCIRVKLLRSLPPRFKVTNRL